MIVSSVLILSVIGLYKAGLLSLMYPDYPLQYSDRCYKNFLEVLVTESGQLVSNTCQLFQHTHVKRSYIYTCMQ